MSWKVNFIYVQHLTSLFLHHCSYVVYMYFLCNATFLGPAGRTVSAKPPHKPDTGVRTLCTLCAHGHTTLYVHMYITCMFQVDNRRDSNPGMCVCTQGKHTEPMLKL